jgi:hypothetical protein
MCAREVQVAHNFIIGPGGRVKRNGENQPGRMAGGHNAFQSRPCGPRPGRPHGRLRNVPEKLSVPVNVSVPAPKSMKANDGLAVGLPNEATSLPAPSRAE